MEKALSSVRRHHLQLLTTVVWVGTPSSGTMGSSDRDAEVCQIARKGLRQIIRKATILRLLGCDEVFFTPSSHDQGVDGFGTRKLVPPTQYGTTHGLTWIAQAKHYQSIRVTSSDVRELVGSKELLVAKIFSTVDERYKELRLKPNAPTAMALITTEEIYSTVRRLADGAGIFVFASSDR